MTFEEFRATRKPVTDEAWAVIVEVIQFPLARSAYFEYDTEVVLHEADGAFYPHTWWYTPNAHATLEAAERDLFAWRAEFL